jgi:aspartyl aminopeptidase
MANSNVTASLMKFLDESPSPYHAVAAATGLLNAHGFHERNLSEQWPPAGAWYVRRGGALIAGWSPTGVNLGRGARIIGAHTDSPTLRLKPRPDTGIAGWRQVGIEVYGGALLNSWLDRDLGLSGRVIASDGHEELVRIDRPLLRVAQLAIHLDREVNERGVVLDRQQHLTPLWGLGHPRPGEVQELLAQAAGLETDEVMAWDVMVHDLTAAALLGLDNEFLASGRIDNLCSCFAAITALCASVVTGDADRPMLVALFDHEEVGSESTTGASGPMLEWALNHLVRSSGGGPGEMTAMLANSRCVSADMAHAVHPNYPERHEPDHRPLPNGGPVIKVNASQRYATDATTAAAFAADCRAVDVPYQYFVSRNSMPCGSTIGPLTATRLGIATVDVGCAQLSMHSARELMGAHDPDLYGRALMAFLCS